MGMVGIVFMGTLLHTYRLRGGSYIFKGVDMKSGCKPFTVTKGNAFLLSLVSLFLIYIITLIFDDTALHVLIAAVAPLVITAIQVISVGFIGFSVADNGVKGKFFNANLVENKEKKDCVEKDV